MFKTEESPNREHLDVGNPSVKGVETMLRTVKGTDDSLRGGRHISSNSYKVSRKERKYTIIPECPDSREKGERIMLFHRKRKRRREEEAAVAAAKANFSNCSIQNGMRQLLKSKLAVTRVVLHGFIHELNLRL